MRFLNQDRWGRGDLRGCTVAVCNLRIGGNGKTMFNFTMVDSDGEQNKIAGSTRFSFTHYSPSTCTNCDHKDARRNLEAPAFSIHLFIELPSSIASTSTDAHFFPHHPLCPSIPFLIRYPTIIRIRCILLCPLWSTMALPRHHPPLPNPPLRPPQPMD